MSADCSQNMSTQSLKTNTISNNCKPQTVTNYFSNIITSDREILCKVCSPEISEFLLKVWYIMVDCKLSAVQGRKHSIISVITHQHI